MALVQIKTRITSDPLGIMELWSDPLHFCGWYGVMCRVIALYLSCSKLAGTVRSPFVGNPSFLRVLNISDDSIRGTIPPDVGNLTKLLYLWLWNNSVGGIIPPNISPCTILIRLENWW